MNRQETVRALKICSGQQPCAQCPLNEYASDADKCKHSKVHTLFSFLKCKQKLMEEALRVIETNTQYHRNTRRVHLRSAIQRMNALLKTHLYYPAHRRKVELRVLDEDDLDTVTKQLLEEIK